MEPTSKAGRLQQLAQLATTMMWVNDQTFNTPLKINTPSKSEAQGESSESSDFQILQQTRTSPLHRSFS